MEDAYPGIMSIIRSTYGHQRLQSDTIDIITSSLSKNSLKQYNVTLKKWWFFCSTRDKDPFNFDIPFILEFLTNIFNSGVSYSSLNTYRSALALIFGKRFSENDIVTRFLKGVFRSRPSFPKYQTTWDPNVVLIYLTRFFPNEEISLLQITKKAAVLLALSTGQRVQTLSLIRLCNVQISDSVIEIVINDIIKTSAPYRPMPRLVIPFFPNKIEICPAKTLSSYLEATSSYRTSENTNHLFLTTRKPIHNACSSTISRWIKDIMSESGVNTEIFSAHSTRHASTSAAQRQGLSIDLIKKCAGWSGDSLVFAKFYNRPLTSNNEVSTFAEAVYDNN